MIYLVSNQANAFDSKLFRIVDIDKSLDILSGLPETSLDTETTGLCPYTKTLLLLQMGDENNQVLYDIASFGGVVPPKLVKFMNDSNTLYILQNAKFDCKFLFAQGIILKRVFDTMLAETILTNGLQYDGRDLATLSEKYCGIAMDKSVRGEIITKGLSDRVLLYGANDIKHLGTIKRKQLAIAKQLDLVEAINLDNSFVIVLAYVEYCGIKIDMPKWLERTKTSKEKVYILKKDLEDQLWKDGMTKYFSGMVDLFSGAQDCILNWDSPKQVAALFKDYGINVVVKEKGKDVVSINASVLEPQKDQFPILPLYLKYKELQKEVSTYGENWKKYVNPVTGRIHTTFKQLMDTGRLSSGSKFDNTPNIQNLPSDAATRACFIPENGCEMIDADYSGQETIVLVNQSMEKNLINFYKKGLDDMHSYVAFLMYKEIRPCELDHIDGKALEYIKKKHKDKRQIAKAAGFAIAYGGNGVTISKNCSIPREDGEFVYDSYFAAFPGMKQYFVDGFEETAMNGYITFNGITKRKYFYNPEKNDYFANKEVVESPYFWQTVPDAREINKKYNKAKSDIQRMSQNYRIQGTAADITKYACIILFREILKRGWWMKVKIVNLVHDEILAECPIELVEEVKALVVYSMEQAGKPFCRTVPLKAEAISGDHWVH